jgi:hypothetical protein
VSLPRAITFTTAALDRSSLWLFEASPYRATPKGQPSSFVQLTEPTAAEPVERRAGTKGNADQQSTWASGSSREGSIMYGLRQVPARVRDVESALFPVASADKRRSFEIRDREHRITRLPRKLSKRGIVHSVCSLVAAHALRRAHAGFHRGLREVGCLTVRLRIAIRGWSCSRRHPHMREALPTVP